MYYDWRVFLVDRHPEADVYHVWVLWIRQFCNREGYHRDLWNFRDHFQINDTSNWFSRRSDMHICKNKKIETMWTIIIYPYLGNSSLRKQVKMSISSSAHRSGRRIIICSSIRHLRVSKATTSFWTRTKLSLVYERARNVWEKTIIYENAIV
jgi:hypothetical protein